MSSWPYRRRLRHSLPWRLQLGGGRDQHAAGAAGGVVDRLARLRLQHQRHQMYEGAVGVELLGGVAGVVGELLDQVLVAVAELVLGQVRDRQRLAREVLDEVCQRGVGEQVLVAPVAVAEHAGQGVGVGGLDGAHGLEDRGTDVLGDAADVVPVAAVRDGEAVILGEVGQVLVAVDLQGGGVLFVVDVGDPLEEDEREDVLLVVAGVDQAAQHDRGAPQVGLQFALADARRAHADTPSPHFASSASSAARVSARPSPGRPPGPRVHRPASPSRRCRRVRRRGGC